MLDRAPASRWVTHRGCFPRPLFRACKGPQPGILVARRPYRQFERAHTGVDAKRDPLRSRPDNRPIGSRDCDTDAVPGGKGVPYVVELDDRLAALAANKRFGKFVALSMREIEHAIADACGGPIETQIIEAHDHLSHRLVAVKDQPKPGHAEDLKRLA